MYPPSIYLLDGNGGAWLLGATTGGIPTTSFAATPTTTPVTAIFLRDSAPLPTHEFWAMTVTTTPIAGIRQQNPTITSTARTEIVVSDSNNNYWAMRLFNGIVVTTPATGCLPQITGTIYIPNYNGIPWAQPGGQGTTVFPQQQSGPWLNYPVGGQFFIEASGLWVAGCGHYMDYPEVFRDFDPCANLSVALVCCPICSYIQYGFEPYEVFDDPMQNPITII